MVTIVIPFAGEGGKTRLHESAGLRNALAAAMFEDVLAACRPVGSTIVAESPGGQGFAVEIELDRVEGPVVIVNADLPCVAPADVRLLAESAPALVSAADGTTNALSLPSADLFLDLYGPASAERFHAQCGALPIAVPNLADDVDTMDDLVRLAHRAGPHTRAAFAELRGSLA